LAVALPVAAVLLTVIVTVMVDVVKRLVGVAAIDDVNTAEPASMITSLDVVDDEDACVPTALPVKFTVPNVEPAVYVQTNCWVALAARDETLAGVDPVSKEASVDVPPIVKVDGATLLIALFPVFWTSMVTVMVSVSSTAEGETEIEEVNS